jgi:Na+/melibiose symporter-like transporter
MLPAGWETITVEAPYLVLLPTMLLSAGMLMFFTLGAAMVGDVCDEDELQKGTRSEGTYYSVFWWFIKMGTAFASLVMGYLLVQTGFDEKQNVAVDALAGDFAVIKADAELWLTEQAAEADRLKTLVERLDRAADRADQLKTRLQERQAEHPNQAAHAEELAASANAIAAKAAQLKAESETLVGNPQQLVQNMDDLLEQTALLRLQSPQTLFRLRAVEIGLPLLLSILSIGLTLRYPLTEARSYEIKQALEERRKAQANPATG